MVNDLNDDDVTLPVVSDDRVEEPPERGQILDAEVLKPILVPKAAGNAILPHELAMKAVCEKD